VWEQLKFGLICPAEVASAPTGYSTCLAQLVTEPPSSPYIHPYLAKVAKKKKFCLAQGISTWKHVYGRTRQEMSETYQRNVQGDLISNTPNTVIIIIIIIMAFTSNGVGEAELRGHGFKLTCRSASSP
jgi:hypothetical protein